MPQPCAADKRRWYILLIFTFVGLNQSLIWGSLSALPDDMKQYFHGISDATLDLFLNWGPILYLPFAVVCGWILTGTRGVRWCTLLGGLFTTLGAFVRCLPVFFGAHFRDVHPSWCIALLHIGQILNAIAGPLVMAPPPRLAAEWFPAHERALATAISASGAHIGPCIGFLLSSFVHLPVQLITIWAMSLVPFAAMLLYLPYEPASPPSLSASSCIVARQEADLQTIIASPEADKQSNGMCEPQELENASDGQESALLAAESVAAEGCVAEGTEATQANRFLDVGTYARALAQLMFHNRSFLLAMLTGSCTQGLFNVWQVTLSQTIPNDLYSQSDRAKLGFASTCATFLGGIALGTMLFRRHSLHRHMKTLLMLSMVLSLGAVTWFAFVLPNTFFPLHRSSYTQVLLSLLFTSAGAGFIQPLTLEFTAELAYPQSEGVAGAISTFFENLVPIFFLIVLPYIPNDSIALYMSLGTGLLVVPLIFVRPAYRRADMEMEERGSETQGLLGGGTVALSESVGACGRADDFL